MVLIVLQNLSGDVAGFFFACGLSNDAVGS
jgi:hypothetical protein